MKTSLKVFRNLIFIRNRVGCYIQITSLCQIKVIQTKEDYVIIIISRLLMNVPHAHKVGKLSSYFPRAVCGLSTPTPLNYMFGQISSYCLALLIHSECDFAQKYLTLKRCDPLFEQLQVKQLGRQGEQNVASLIRMTSLENLSFCKAFNFIKHKQSHSRP